MVSLMDFSEPKHSKKAVRRAGEMISKGTAPESEIEEAKEIVADFRSVHAYPLLSVTNHVRNRAFKVSDGAIVAQRMKRLPTIIDKLERHPDMVVTTMQDFGGCRAIMSSLDEVIALADDLKGTSRAKNKIVREYDYIFGPPGPRNSGYRGIHLVYEYQATKVAYHGYRVELQIRTQLQHSWATAVETMDLFSGTELKYSKGDPDIRRYFTIVSSLMAASEGTPLVEPGKATVRELREELKRIDQKHTVLARLSGYRSVVNEHAQSSRRSFLTLELNRAEASLRVTVHESQARAEDRLDELEAREDTNLDVVLVGIKQVGQLQAAYPNYFADTSMFTDFVGDQLNQS